MISQLETPVLFIVFNRPDTTKIVFEAIREARPTKLFIASDGPRYPLKHEYALGLETRAIAEQVDWPCEVKTLFRDQNLGCGKGVSSAINWFFENVEEGIILEDDCLPSQDFFTFCSQLLALYRTDQTVMTICGTTLLEKKYREAPGHYLGNSNGVWGWATWRRAWQLYDYEMKRLAEQGVQEKMKAFFNNDLVFDHVLDTFNLIVKAKMDTWDIQWYFTILSNNAYAACPFQNMISNIGYQGAHDTEKSRLHDRKYLPIDLNRVRLRCLDNVLVREAELYHFRFHGVYPKYVMLWRIEKKIFEFYVASAIRLLGQRPLRLEGYVSALRWHSKSFYRGLLRRVQNIVGVFSR